MKRIVLVVFMCALSVCALQAQTYIYYGPHVTAQPPWLNKLVVYNNGADMAPVNVRILDTVGEYVFWEDYAIPGNSSIVLVWPTEAGYVPGVDEIVLNPEEGSLEVVTDNEKVRPKASFRYGSQESLTEFFLSGRLAWEYILPNTVEANFSWTGLAMINPYAHVLPVILEAYLAGQLQGTLEVLIEPMRKYVNLSGGIWPGLGYTGFDQVKIYSVVRSFPPPMSITGNDAQDRHVFFNGAPTAFTKPGAADAGTLYATDSIVGDMRLAPATTFIQGSPEEEFCSENSGERAETQFVHTLTRDIAVMATEVTRKMWADLKAVQGSLPADPSSYSGDNRPVETVSWYEALLFANLLSQQQGLTTCYYKDGSFTTPVDAGNYTTGDFFCDWSASGFRLPTEGEWEYFCRAGTFTPFWMEEPNYIRDNCEEEDPVAGTWPNLEAAAWFMVNRYDPAGNDMTKPVAQKAVNPWGFYDLNGNVHEWCWDWLGQYPDGSVTDYRGPSTGAQHILRGGGWHHSIAKDLRSANRLGVPPHTKVFLIGFRLCRNAD